MCIVLLCRGLMIALYAFSAIKSQLYANISFIYGIDKQYYKWIKTSLSGSAKGFTLLSLGNN